MKNPQQGTLFWSLSGSFRHVKIKLALELHLDRRDAYGQEKAEAEAEKRPTNFSTFAAFFAKSQQIGMMSFCFSPVCLFW